jgi:hypothetical protein
LCRINGQEQVAHQKLAIRRLVHGLVVACEIQRRRQARRPLDEHNAAIDPNAAHFQEAYRQG